MAAAVPVDPMMPREDGRPVVCGPLSGVTIASADLNATRRFYGGALELRFEPIALSPAVRQLAQHWGATPATEFEMLEFTRPGIPEAIRVRVIGLSKDRPTSRPALDCRYDGPLGIGVPVHGLARRHAIVEGYGFKANAGVTTMTFPRADGSMYDIGETHWVAPDDVMVPGVDRAHLQPVGPVDPALYIGGPSYASALVSDVAVHGVFLDAVLGYELRREFTFESEGPDGGMRLPKVTRVRFQQWFAPGTRTCYLVIMQLLEHGLRAREGLGLKNRGIGLWSFPTRVLDEVLDRAHRHGAPILRAPTDLDVPGVGPVRSMILATPDGFPIEVFQC